MIVTHCSSVHPRKDSRILFKMCASLAASDYDVKLIVADGQGAEKISNLEVIDVGKPRNRIERILLWPDKIFTQVISLLPEIVHLHDPELIPLASRLKRMGIKVIFDSHEDVALQMRSKPYMNRFLSWVISQVYRIYETQALKKTDAVVAATPEIARKLRLRGIPCTLICNFPRTEIIYPTSSLNKKRIELCYVGNLTKNRGIIELIKAIELCKAKLSLNLCGAFESEQFEKKIRNLPGWQKVNYWGCVRNDKIKKILNRSKIGIVTLLPKKNYLESYPIKMFEYMSAGLPVIASNFPLWKKIIQKQKVGLVCDPTKPEAIANRIDTLLKNKKLGRHFGRNGRAAVEKKYNWKNEEKKLFRLYKSLT